VYFDKEPDKTSDKDIFSAKVIPSRGAWLEFDIDKRDTVGVRIDRKRKQPSPCCSRRSAGPPSRSASGSAGPSLLMRATLEKDHTPGQDEALLDIYRKLRPGEPPTRRTRRPCWRTCTSTRDHFGNRRLRTVGELIQNQSASACPAWSASSASA
jgi:DNA-directed RNA polymerase subunit beta